MEKYVLYYRVSTKRQGVSGLGLQAQQTTMMNYLATCREHEIIGIYEDVESGKNDLRPELMKAIALVKQHNGRLLIAALDRLSRSVAFIATLLDQQVAFTACDIPEANEFTVHIIAAVAQFERKRIGERTRKAIAEAKARGKQIGNPASLTNEGRKLGNLERQKIARANEFNKAAYNAVKVYKNETGGDFSYLGLVKFVNDLQLQTRNGNKWTYNSIKKLIRLYERENQPETASR